ncbi:MAG: GTP 3',8-cyclase MoaA [Armatimonadetes bacterium]|nr:GTP 3',8-cyclase MoaA [Armatimonadota bacterium]MDE2206784.1 GTP 3',8-cyclase MoaA [Armatimonadota bacterium]
MPLIDSYNRCIDYLRVSVTDRCNFRCVYCMPLEGAETAPRDEILTCGEIVRLVRIAARLGMHRIRLTGGEPLVRPDIIELTAGVAATPGLKDFSLTTNGFLLARHAAALAAAGLNRVNISLDTLRSDRFEAIARKGKLEPVLQGIAAAIANGLTPIKLNCVVMRGWNDDEVVAFAARTLSEPLNVRFIELMPINWSRGDDSIQDWAAGPLPTPRRGDGTSQITLFASAEAASFRKAFVMQESSERMLDGEALRRAWVSSSESQARIEAEFGPLEPAELLTNGPARTYRIPGAAGTVGFISQISNDLCERCNRLRLTADGFLRPCLMADGEVNLRVLLRNGASDHDLAEQFITTVRHKPKEHRIEDGLMPSSRSMSQIGG